MEIIRQINEYSEAKSAEMVTDIFDAIDMGDFTIDRVQLQQKCLHNGQQAGEKALEQIEPGLSDTAKLARIKPTIENAILQTMKSYTAVETAAKTILAYQKYGKTALTINAIDARILVAENNFATMGARVAHLVDTKAIQPVTRIFGGKSYQIVRVGKTLFARNIAAHGAKIGTAATGAFYVLNVALAAYSAKESLDLLQAEVQNFAQLLESEGKTSITDSMVSIIEHNKNQHARLLADDTVKVQDVLNETNTARKLLGARTVVIELLSQSKVVNIKTDRSVDKQWFETMGDWLARPTEWMCEQMLEDPDQYREHQALSRLSMLAVQGEKIIEDLMKRPSTEEVVLTILALEKAVALAKEIIRNVQSPTLEQLGVVTEALRKAQQVARAHNNA